MCSPHCRTGIWERGCTRCAFCQKCPIYDQFGPLWTSVRPPNDNFWRNKWYHTIALDVPHLDPTLIHTDPPVWSLQGHLWPQKSHLWPFWRPMAPSYGHSGPGKRSQHITQDVPCPDPTWIHTDPPVGSLQGGLLYKYDADDE